MGLREELKAIDREMAADAFTDVLRRIYTPDAPIEELDKIGSTLEQEYPSLQAIMYGVRAFHEGAGLEREATNRYITGMLMAFLILKEIGEHQAIDPSVDPKL